MTEGDDLLAVPVPAAGEDEVEAVARAIAGCDWRDEAEDVRHSISGCATAVLTTLAPYRAAQVAEAEERGRRAGLAEALAAVDVADTGERGAYAAGFWDARDAIRRLAGDDTTTPTDEEGPR